MIDMTDHKYSMIDIPDQKSAQSAGAIEYTDCISAEDDSAPLSVQDKTLNNLIVKFQSCFEECKVLLHCHHSQFHSVEFLEIELFVHLTDVYLNC